MMLCAAGLIEQPQHEATVAAKGSRWVRVVARCRMMHACRTHLKQHRAACLVSLATFTLQGAVLSVSNTPDYLRHG